MARGRTQKGRRIAESQRALRRAAALWQRGVLAPPLFATADHGSPITFGPTDVQARDAERWIEPFLAANDRQLRRLNVKAETRSCRSGVRLELIPGDRIGAVPLLSPTTRRVAAGLLIRPRFGWPSVGAVLGGIGYRVEPDVGGAQLVPGSAREVPSWILAGPVLARLGALIRRFQRRFVEANEVRERPRGRVDWTDYAQRSLPSGRWQEFRCVFPDLQADPWLASALRWTLRRVAADLEPTSDSAVGRRLIVEAQALHRQLGPGEERRPGAAELERFGGDSILGDLLRAALEAIGWVRDERGLGGSRSLDGLAWSLATDQLWEAWVESLFAALAQRTGARLGTARQGSTRRPILWRSPVHTLGHLAPDLVLQWPDRTVWIDAKYKAHLLEIQQRGWRAVPDDLREAHRADLHQAIAYASLADTVTVETWLVYPIVSDIANPIPSQVMSRAEISSGSRKVRLVLGGLPFGFRGPDQRELVLQYWERALREQLS